jgi:hypothetical protein
VLDTSQPPALRRLVKSRAPAAVLASAEADDVSETITTTLSEIVPSESVAAL